MAKLSKRKRVYAFLGVLLLSAATFLYWIHWDAEEFLVDGALLKERFSEKVAAYLILDTTFPWGRIGISPFHARQLGLKWDSIIDYSVKNLLRARIPARLQLPHSYSFVSQEDLARMNDPGFLRSTEGADLQKRMTQSWGVITISRVGFDFKRKHAVAYVQLTYCGLCGGGFFAYLSKESGEWHVVKEAGTWISDRKLERPDSFAAAGRPNQGQRLARMIEFAAVRIHESD